MPFPPIGVPLSPLGYDVQSRALFDLDFRSVDFDPDSGGLQALSGQVGTFSRGATLAGVNDASGVTYTALDGQLAFEQRDWDNDGVREAFGLRMGTSDRLAFPTTLRPMALAGMLEFIETGARTTVGSTLLAYSNDAATGARLWLDTSGSFYRAQFTDGTTTRTATLASGAPVSGDRVVLYFELTSAGVLSIFQSINGGATTTASAAALALPATWAASSSWRLNSQGTATGAAQGWYRRAKVVPGALNQTTIAERR